MQMQVHKETEIDMEMEMVEMVILKLRRRVGSSDLHRKESLALDVEDLEVSKAPKGDQESLKKLPKRPQEARTRFFGGALGARGGPKSSPRYIP